MDPVALVSILSAVAAAVWTAWTWSEEHKQQRQIKRDQAAALYVNPFLIVIREAESRLHGILHRGELALYKRENPGRHELGSPPAIETVYLLSSLFGWAYTNLRYGPYTRDRVTIETTARIARVFSSRDAFDDDAFRFSPAVQASLGETVMRRVGEAGSALPEFGVVTFFEFVQDFMDAKGQRAALYRSRTVRRAIEAIDRADRPEDLAGRERLAAVQHLMLRLLNHLEQAEGFSLSSPRQRRGDRREAPVDAATAMEGAPEILHRTKGRIRVGIPRLRDDEAYAEELESLLRTWNDVESVHVNTATGSVIIKYHTTVPHAEFEARIRDTIGGPAGKANAPKTAAGPGPGADGGNSSRNGPTRAAGAASTRRGRPARPREVASR